MRHLCRLGLALSLFGLAAVAAPAIVHADVAPSCSGRCDVGPRQKGAGPAIAFIASGAALLGLIQLRSRRR